MFVVSFKICKTQNVGGGRTVGIVEAFDGDSGRNGEIRFYVTNGKEDFGESILTRITSLIVCAESFVFLQSKFSCWMSGAVR